MEPVAGGVAPNVPLGDALDVALRAEDELVDAIGLIDVELQGLRGLRVLQVEVEIVSEIVDGVIAAELLPPERVRIWGAAADVELGCLAVERGRRDVFTHGVGGNRSVGVGSGADRAVLPAGHLVDVGLDDGSGGRGWSRRGGRSRTSRGAQIGRAHVWTPVTS